MMCVPLSAFQPLLCFQPHAGYERAIEMKLKLLKGLGIYICNPLRCLNQLAQLRYNSVQILPFWNGALHVILAGSGNVGTAPKNDCMSTNSTSGLKITLTTSQRAFEE